MKRLHKILLFTISFIGLTFSFGILSFFDSMPHIASIVSKCYSLFPWSKNFLLGYCIIVSLCFFSLLLITILFPSESSELILVKSKGKLHFSKQTIESTVYYSFVDVDGINRSIVKVKLSSKPENMKIFVKLSLSDSSKMVELTETIQEKIEFSLNLSLGISVQSINIKVAEFRQSQEPQKESDINTTKSHRVI